MRRALAATVILGAAGCGAQPTAIGPSAPPPPRSAASASAPPPSSAAPKGWSRSVPHAVECLIVGADGEVYLLGQGPATSAARDASLGITKLDAEGELAWTHAFGADAVELSSRCGAVRHGDLVVAGGYRGELALDPGAPHGDARPRAGADSWFLARFGPGGELGSSHAWTGDAYLGTPTLALGPDGRMALAGRFTGELTLGATTLSSPGWQGLLVELAEDASVLRARVFDAALDGLGGAAYDARGELLVGGLFAGLVDLGGGPEVSKGTTGVLARFDAAGRYLDSTALPELLGDLGIGADGVGWVVGGPFGQGWFAETLGPDGAPRSWYEEDKGTARVADRDRRGHLFVGGSALRKLDGGRLVWSRPIEASLLAVLPSGLVLVAGGERKLDDYREKYDAGVVATLGPDGEWPSCAAARACAELGACSAAGTRCTPLRDEDCKDSVVCRIAGRCSVRVKEAPRWSDRTEPGREGTCVAARDEDCRGTRGCREHGRCHAFGDKCVAVGAWCRPGATCGAPRSDAECAQTVGCSELGECAFAAASEACTPTLPEHCAAAKACVEEGACHVGKRDGEPACVPRTSQDCRASAACRRDGRCRFGVSYLNGAMAGGSPECGVDSKADCEASEGCRERGACTALPRIVGDGSQVCWLTSSEDCRRTRACADEGRCRYEDGRCGR